MYSSKSNRIKSQQQLDRKMIEIVREEEHVTWKKYLIIWSLNLWSKNVKEIIIIVKIIIPIFRESSKNRLKEPYMNIKAHCEIRHNKENKNSNEIILTIRVKGYPIKSLYALSSKNLLHNY